MLPVDKGQGLLDVDFESFADARPFCGAEHVDHVHVNCDERGNVAVESKLLDGGAPLGMPTSHWCMWASLGRRWFMAMLTFFWA